MAEVAPLSAGKRAYVEEVLGLIGDRPDERVAVLEAGVGVTGRAVASRLSGAATFSAIDRDATNIAGLSDKLAASARCDVSQLVVGDIGAMEQFADASFDVVGSDTVVAMLGVELHRPFSEMLRVLRPGGALVLRELLPPCPDGTTRRDLFLRVMLSARTLIGDGYTMLPPPLVVSVLRVVGFNQVTYRMVHEPEEDPVPAQWYPLGSHDFPLAQTFIDHYLEQSSACTVSGGSVADSYVLVARRPDHSAEPTSAAPIPADD